MDIFSVCLNTDELAQAKILRNTNCWWEMLTGMTNPSSKAATLGVQEWDYPGSCSPWAIFQLHIPDTSTSRKQSTNGQ